MTQEIITTATRQITGTNNLTGKKIVVTIEIKFNASQRTPEGRWMVCTNGKPCRWWAQEWAAMANFHRARIDGFGQVSF